MALSVFCIAKTHAQAEAIVARLQEEGFAVSDISVLYPDSGGRSDVGHVITTKAPEGIAAGATAGGFAGGVIGLLAGLGVLAIPGLGAFIAAGPIMAALSGIGIGATAGGVFGGLIGIGVPEFEAKRYEERLKSGNYLVSVHTTNSTEVERAKHVFKVLSGEDVVTSLESPVPQE